METRETKRSTRQEEADGASEKITARPKRSRKRSIVIFCGVTLLNAGLLALLWWQLLTPAPRQGPNASSNGLDNNPLVGHAAPDFTLSALSAHTTSPLRLQAFRGKPIVLNFWASWCEPCHAEAPLLQRQWQQAQADGVVFLGIDYQDTQSDGLSFLHLYGISYPNVMDANGATAINYGVTATPETFFIDARGIVTGWHAGSLDARLLQSFLQKLAR